MSAQADYSRRKNEEKSECGKIPPPKDPARKARGEKSLLTFAKDYFPRRFKEEFGKPHLELIRSLERIIRHGGLHAVAIPRGYGKTAITDVAVLWAVLYGHRSYVAYFAATGPMARKRIIAVKRELMTNKGLGEDFPEVCKPIRHLKNVSQRAHSATCEGEPTRIIWAASQIVFPTIAKYPKTSGAAIECGGLLAASRGLNITTEEGEVRRPDIAILDDPQTRKSAKSRGQTKDREDIINGDLLYLAGHDTTMACACSITIMYDDDLGDRLTDRNRNPQWNGQREKMLIAFPKRMDLWDRYGAMQRAGETKQASAFYRKNRKPMDRGGKVTWDGMGDEGEDSPLQHAMNLYYRDRNAFMCEAQGTPEQPDQGDVIVLTAPMILGKRSEFQPLVCPPNTLKITAFADVHKPLLYYAVAAYGPQMTGQLLTFGAWPDQGKHYWTLTTAQRTIQQSLPTLGTLQAQILAALQNLGRMLAGLNIVRPDGKRQPVDLLMVDANWGETTDQVYQFAAGAPLPTLPSHGRYYGARHKPLGTSTPEAGANYGQHWMVPPIRPHRQARAAIWDTNRWKSDLARAIAAPPGTPGAWYLPSMPDDHLRMLTEHLLAEKAAKITGPYGDVDEYVLLPNEDNHLFDCCVGTLVGASILGLTRTAVPVAAKPVAKKSKTTVRF